jgi:hypothetical protein
MGPPRNPLPIGSGKGNNDAVWSSKAPARARAADHRTTAIADAHNRSSRDQVWWMLHSLSRMEPLVGAQAQAQKAE